MIDVIGAITLTAFAVASPGTLILVGPVDIVTARRLAGAVAAWFVLIAGLAAAGFFSAASPVGIPAIAAAVLAPVLAIALSTARRSTVWRLAFGIPVAALVGVHASRVLGLFFVWLHAEGRLPWTFATYAGWGDMAVGALAVPVAWLAHRRVDGWRPTVLAWNTIGLVDAVGALTLGVGSAPASPVRFIYESPDTGTMGTLPWLLVPGFLMPMYILTHLAVFAQLAAGDGRASDRP